MPGVHRVSALLKRWLAGTLHYSVSDKHLNYYLDEFTFRFNRRNANARGLLFHRLIQQALTTDPTPTTTSPPTASTNTSGTSRNTVQ